MEPAVDAGTGEPRPSACTRIALSGASGVHVLHAHDRAGLPYGRDTDLVCDNVGMTPAEKFRAALELHEAGVAVMRQNLRRRNPGASDAEIDELLSAWMRTRPGAEHGDAVGRPSSRLRG